MNTAEFRTKMSYDEESKEYVVESLDYNIIGVGNTKQEAEKIFYELMESLLKSRYKPLPKGEVGKRSIVK